MHDADVRFRRQVPRRTAPAGAVRPWVSFVGGVVLASTGAAIAGPYLAKDGSASAVVGGLLCAGTGVSVAAGGALALLRGRCWWARLVRATALVLVAYVLAVPVGVGVAATHVPPIRLGGATPADVGLDHEDVLLRTADGVELAGWYVPSRDGAAVVLRHGAGSTRTSVLDHAAVLARHGFGVLLVDARGHGGSGGRAMDLGWYGDLDVDAAVSFLAARPDVDEGRIGVVGLSMGGEEAIGASGGDDRVRAVVAEGATGRVAADDAWLSGAYGARGWFQERVQWLTTAVTDLLTRADPPSSLRAAVARSSAPTLLVAAGDVADEARAARFVEAASPEDVDVWVVPGAGHTDGLAADPTGWEQRVTAFLTEHLRGGRP